MYRIKRGGGWRIRQIYEKWVHQGLSNIAVKNMMYKCYLRILYNMDKYLFQKFF